jgi:pSer/pThr/pTyr-binding forkhead associated (FHA) protein
MQKTLPQSATLLVKIQGLDSKSIELTHETITIGRKADNSLAIEDPAVSGHHARIVKIQAVFFLEDLMSTNGTAINGRPITRHQLHDTDVITIGRHRLVFQELTAPSTAFQAPFVDLNQTMVVKRTDPTPNEPVFIATVYVIAGKTDRPEYSLMKQVNAIGSQDGSAIRLTGWFAPKAAATIARRGRNYSISQSQSTKPLLINGVQAVGEQHLKDGDHIEVAGVTLRFSVSSKTNGTTS